MVNRPEYIQRKNIEAMELKRRAKDATEIEDPKRQRRAGSVEPLDITPNAPELPPELKEKQVKLFLIEISSFYWFNKKYIIIKALAYL